MSTGPLFDAVLSGLIETFSPSLEITFRKNEPTLSSTSMSEEDFEQFFQNLFTSIPENIAGYSKIIRTVTNFAKANPNEILISLASKFKSECNRPVGSPFVLLQISSLNFRLSNVYHFHFLRFFHLFVLTDLISDLIREMAENKLFSKATPLSKIIPCGFHLCQPTQQFKLVTKQLLTKWGYIFHKISEYDINDISLCFSQHLDEHNMDQIFYLISFVQCTQQLVDNVLTTTQQAKKKKQLTSKMLSALARLISTTKCEDDVLQEFFNIAWSVRSSDMLKNGAIDLITALLPLVSNEKKKIPSFYKDRVYKHIQVDSKLQRSANAFLRLIRGNSTGADIDKFLPEEFAGCKGPQTEPTAEFIKYFFNKANYSICPKIFVEIYVQLCAIDTSYFIQHLLEPSLEKSGIIHNVALISLSHILTPKFRSYSKISSQDIDSIKKIGRMALLGDLTSIEHTKTIINENCTISSYYGSTNSEIYAFLTQNKLNFDIGKEYSNTIETTCDPYSLQNAVACSCEQLLEDEDLNDITNVKAMLIMASAADPMLHTRALKTIKRVYKNSSQDLILNCIEVLKVTMSTDVRRSALEVIFNVISHNEIDCDLAFAIESVAFVMLASNLRDIRVVALAILRRLAVIDSTSLLHIFNKDEVVEQVSFMIRTVQTPDTPVHETPIENVPDWEKVARSSYNTLWYYYYSVLISIAIDKKPDILLLLREFGSCLSKQAFSDKVITNAIPYMTLIMNTYADQFDPETSPIIQDCINYAKTIIDTKNNTNIIYLIQSFKFLNYRVIPSLVDLIVTLDAQFYAELAHSLSQIIQIPIVFSNTIPFLFNPIIEFLAFLQSYFITNSINSQRNFEWDDKMLDAVKHNQEMCIDYCVIVAAFFNNIHDQITEDEWPLSNRQVMVKMLIHWVNIPGNFPKLQAYAMNALIPLISSGTIFTDGFEFEPKMLDKLIAVQLEGYPVLDSLVLFHVDILLTEFISQYFLRPHRIATIFANAVIGATDNFVDRDTLQMHAGPLVLFAQEISEFMMEEAKTLLVKLSDLFLDTSTSQVIEEAQNMDFVTTLFEFATEQIISFGLKTIKEMAKQKLPVKHLVELVTPWFSKIRILPTNSLITNCAGTMKKFRCFNVLTFFQQLADVTTSLDDEQSIFISMFWIEMMKLLDNSKVALIVLYTMEDTATKTKIFQLLCDDLAGIVTKFLAKRCRFSYWYYAATHEIPIDSMMWSIPILQCCFSEHISEAAPYYSTVLHFSLLFNEECQKLYENLFNVFGDDTPEQIEMLGITGQIPDDKLGDIAQIISNKLGQQPSATALEKWSLEAIKWATCCKNLKVATRSMIILNAIGAPINPFFMTLLKESVIYQLNAIYEDYTQFGKYMKAVFALLANNISYPLFTGFAFEFASKFIDFSPIMKTANQTALSIFIECFRNNQVAANENVSLIVDAFAPYLNEIEKTPASIQALQDCIELTNSPELKLLNCIIARSRDFSQHTQDQYNDTLKHITTRFQANKMLYFFAVMIESCSEDLMSSIFSSACDLLDKFKDTLSENRLVPICRSALKKIVFIQSAAKFINLLASVNPTIASLEFDQEDGVHSADDVFSGLDQIQTPPGEKSPITNCKEITQMTGMINQINPPKIYPFEPQMEMVNALKRMKKLERTTTSELRRWCSTLTLSSRALSQKSLVTPAMLQGHLLDKIECAPLQILPIKPQLLDLPNDNNFGLNLLVSDADFMELK